MDDERIKVYDRPAAVEAQREYCDEHGLPMFIPENALTHCPSCGKNIFGYGGITVREAGERLITGCPFCSFSFCE